MFSWMVLLSCSQTPAMPAPYEVTEAAYELSFYYIGMDYAWGGQSYWHESNGSVDCSGLVINIYQEVGERYGLKLPFSDTTSTELFAFYTKPVQTPFRGDIIFMGEEQDITHVAIFHRFFDAEIEFLDAYSGTGSVEIRRYPASSPKIKGFGRMLVQP